jgi:hypothetical protein
MRFLFTFLLICIYAASTAQIPSYFPTNGLVGWWPFNGNANDESGNGNHGTVNGATLTIDRFGNAGKAYGFDGINNYIQCNSSISNHSNVSIAGWAYLNSNDGNGFVQIGIDGTNGGCNGYAIGNGGATFTTNGNNLISLVSCVEWNNTNSTIPIQNWFHFALLKNGNVFQHYINGFLVNTKTISNIINPSNSIFIGSSAPQSLNYHNGKLDDIAIYNRTLTQQEITQLYTRTIATSTPDDTSSNVGIGTINPKRKLHVNDVMRLEPRNSAPSNPGEGDIYYDAILKKLRYYNGTSWINL